MNLSRLIVGLVKQGKDDESLTAGLDVQKRERERETRGFFLFSFFLFLIRSQHVQKKKKKKWQYFLSTNQS
jgi:hypothetical protein